MVNFKFIRDIFTEDKSDNKYSSKKFMGILAGMLAFSAFVVDGFHFYNINEGMFDSMLFFSATMLGMSVLHKFAGATKLNDKSKDEAK